MEGKIRIVISVIIVFLMISSGIIPVLTASKTEIDNNISEIENGNIIPEYIEVTKYNFRGIGYTKEIINISYSEAMRLKQEFEIIDEGYFDELGEYNSNIYESSNYNFFNNLNSIIENYFVFNNFRQNDAILLLAEIEGFFGPSVINEVNFFVFAPFFFATALGVDLQYEDVFLPGVTIDFESNRLVSISLVSFVGILIVFPFISPFGYINGVTFLGRLFEY